MMELTDDSFDGEVLNGELPVLVDFWAPWCAPCKMIAPLLDDVATAYEGRLKVAKIDVQAHQKVAQQRRVMGLPTLAIFKGGEEIARKIGAVNRDQLNAFVSDALKTG